MLSIIKPLVIITSLWFFIVSYNTAHAQSPSVVINEVQITGASAKDEFIELYNPTDSDINLEDWRLSKKTQSGNEYNLLTAFPDSVIQSGAYIIIAHSDYTGTSDLIYSTSQSLANNNTLILYSDGGDTIIDLVGWGTASIFEGPNPVSNPSASESISRISSDTDNNATDFILTTPTPSKVNVVTKNNQGVSNDNETEDPSPINQTADGTGQPPSSNIKTTGHIVINELLPNPKGSDTDKEWIELKSIDTQTIDLTGWIISDSSKDYTIDPRKIPNHLINPNGLLLLPRSITGIALNNTGQETITLKDSAKRVSDTIVYSEPVPEGGSWMRDETLGLLWTQAPTPGHENIISNANLDYDTNTANPPSYRTIETSEERGKHTNPTNNTSGITGQKNDAKTLEQELNILIENFFNLKITELLPNPEGPDEEGEWIELYNGDDESIILDGLTIGDASYKTHTLENTTIDAGEYITIPRSVSRISLNNNGDSIKLWAPDGTLIQTVRYVDNTPEGYSYALNDKGLWDWTQTPTPSEENIFTQEHGESVEQKSTNNTKLKSNFLNLKSKHVSLSKIRTLDIGAHLTTQGIVAVEPGVFGKTYFYIIDESSGIKVYSAKKLFPVMSVGDLISVSGTLSESTEELRIKTSQLNDIQFIEHTDLPKPQSINLDEIDEQLEGLLVVVTGEITETSGSSVYLDDRLGEARVYIASNTGINISRLRIGETISATGLMSQTKIGYRILPRSQEDIQKTSQKVAGANTENVLIKNKSNNSRGVYTVLSVITALTITLLILNKKYQWVSVNKKNPTSE